MKSKTPKGSSSISPTIPKDPVIDYKTYTLRKETLSFCSLPPVSAKKYTPTLYHCRPPQFVFCNCKPTLHP